MTNFDRLNPIDQYLLRYGELESQDVPVPAHTFDHVVIIPCYDESPHCLERVFDRLGTVRSSISNRDNTAPVRPKGLARTRRQLPTVNADALATKVSEASRSRDGKHGAPRITHHTHTVSSLAAGNTLAVVVVNAPDDAPPEPLARTRTLWRSLDGGEAVEIPEQIRRRDNAPPERFRWTRTANGIAVLAIDRVNAKQQIPRRQGVGLARKIGADVACALIRKGAIRNPWLYFTDADVRLPRDYLRHSAKAPGSLLLPYRHEVDNSHARGRDGPSRSVRAQGEDHDRNHDTEFQSAADLALAERANAYELHLRYYVDRLRHAGSRYAFHTIGSTLAIHAEVYAKVRGAPKRNAGEDFHLLNKAAKVGPVYAVTRPEIVIRARQSKRVPFGTGPTLHAMQNPQAFPSYAHESFELLKEVIRFIDTGTMVSARTRQLLEELGFFRHLNSAQARHRHTHTLRKSLHQWFDALRTLRFIHLARRHHPDRPLLPTLDGLFGKGDHLANFRAREIESSRKLGVW